VCLTDEKNLAIWAEVGLIRMMPISPQDLSGLTSEQEEYFREDPKAVVYLKYHPDNRFFYLPKYCFIIGIICIFYCNKMRIFYSRLSVGRIVSISRQLPESSPFKDYGELCLYWKNQVSVHCDYFLLTFVYMFSISG
jgi:hypothetical protein